MKAALPPAKRLQHIVTAARKITGEPQLPLAISIVGDNLDPHTPTLVYCLQGEGLEAFGPPPQDWETASSTRQSRCCEHHPLPPDLSPAEQQRTKKSNLYCTITQLKSYLPVCLVYFFHLYVLQCFSYSSQHKKLQTDFQYFSWTVRPTHRLDNCQKSLNFH